MQVDEPKNPQQGPPKKGFWGVLASFFYTPKVKTKPEAVQKPLTEGEESTPKMKPPSAPAPAGGADQATVSSPVTVPNSAVGQKPVAPPNPQEETTSAKENAPDESSVGGTDELQGLGLPTQFDIPPSIKAKGLPENDYNSPTLPTEPEAAGAAHDTTKEEPESMFNPLPDASSPVHLEPPYSNEEGGAHDEQEEGTPPEIVVPQSIKAAGIKENNKNPPALPTRPEADGGSKDDDTVHDAEEFEKVDS